MKHWLFVKSITRIFYTLGVGFLLVGVVLSLVNQPVMAASDAQTRPTVGPIRRSSPAPHIQNTSSTTHRTNPRNTGNSQQFVQPNLRGQAVVDANRMGAFASTIQGYNVVLLNSNGDPANLALTCDFLNPATVDFSVQVTMPDGETNRVKVDWYWVHPAGQTGYQQADHITNVDASNGDVI